MSIAFLAVPIVMLLLCAHVWNNIERYGNSGNLVARSIILISGLLFASVASFLLLKDIAEPSWALGSGFPVGPLFAVAACI